MPDLNCPHCGHALDGDVCPTCCTDMHEWLGVIAELEEQTAQLHRYMENGIDIFMSPCDVHSGGNTPPFHEWLGKYGGQCTICVVDERDALRARVAELEASHEMAQTPCS